MKKLINLIITAFIAHTCSYTYVLPALVQADEEKNIAKPSDNLIEKSGTFPAIKNGSTVSEIVPQIPPPPAVALPPPAYVDTPSTTALNWRSRALALANEYPLKKNSVAWALPISYRRGQLLLRQAITQTGLTLKSEYDDAGQFLVSLPGSDKKCDIIVVSQPVGDKRTLFKMHVYADYRLAEIKRINCLPDAMKNLLENSGLWQ